LKFCIFVVFELVHEIGMFQFDKHARIFETIGLILDHAVNLSKEQRKELHEIRSSHEISLNQIQELSQIIRQEKLPILPWKWVHELIIGTEFVAQTKKKEIEPISSRNEAQFEHLRTNIADKEYAKMTRNVSQEKQLESLMDFREMKNINDQLSIGVNIIVSGIVVFVAGYYIFSRSFGNLPTAVLGGLACSCTVVFAEIWLFLIRTSEREAEAAVKPKKKKGKQPFVPIPDEIRKIIQKQS